VRDGGERSRQKGRSAYKPTIFGGETDLNWGEPAKETYGMASIKRKNNACGVRKKDCVIRANLGRREAKQGGGGGKCSGEREKGRKQVRKKRPTQELLQTI